VDTLDPPALDVSRATVRAKVTARHFVRRERARVPNGAIHYFCLGLLGDSTSDG
jgi:hypothetical protein